MSSSKLAIGIVGLPNVGKSTLFKALTNKQVDIQNYPFTTIDPNVGVVAVPDQRVDALAIMSDSAKKIYATVEFIDIAGLVKGAAQGEGLGNKFLANIREVDAIAQIVRAFEDPNITHVHNRINPAEDIEIINAELILADLETVQKRLDKTSKDFRFGDKKTLAELVLLEKFKKNLEAGTMISDHQSIGARPSPQTEGSWYHSTSTPEEIALAKELNLLTAKKLIYALNVSEEQLLNNWEPDEKLKKVIGNSPHVIMNNKLELTLSEISTIEKSEYLKEFNLPESRLDSLIKTGYKTLGLLTFLTTGEDETRAWTAYIDDPIPRAARAIHTDFERLFIRAEVINWKTLLESDGYSEARAKGLIKTVGRNYIIQEGDVVEVLIGK